MDLPNDLQIWANNGIHNGNQHIGNVQKDIGSYGDTSTRKSISNASNGHHHDIMNSNGKLCDDEEHGEPTTDFIGIQNGVIPERQQNQMFDEAKNDVDDENDEVSSSGNNLQNVIIDDKGEISDVVHDEKFGTEPDVLFQRVHKKDFDVVDIPKSRSFQEDETSGGTPTVEIVFVDSIHELISSDVFEEDLEDVNGIAANEHGNCVVERPMNAFDLLPTAANGEDKPVKAHSPTHDVMYGQESSANDDGPDDEVVEEDAHAQTENRTDEDVLENHRDDLELQSNAEDENKICLEGSSDMDHLELQSLNETHVFENEFRNEVAVLESEVGLSNHEQREQNGEGADEVEKIGETVRENEETTGDGVEDEEKDAEIVEDKEGNVEETVKNTDDDENPEEVKEQGDEDEQNSKQTDADKHERNEAEENANEQDKVDEDADENADEQTEADNEDKNERNETEDSETEEAKKQDENANDQNETEDNAKKQDENANDQNEADDDADEETGEQNETDEKRQDENEHDKIQSDDELEKSRRESVFKLTMQEESLGWPLTMNELKNGDIKTAADDEQNDEDQENKVKMLKMNESNNEKSLELSQAENDLSMSKISGKIILNELSDPTIKSRESNKRRKLGEKKNFIARNKAMLKERNAKLANLQKIGANRYLNPILRRPLPDDARFILGRQKKFNTVGVKKEIKLKTTTTSSKTSPGSKSPATPTSNDTKKIPPIKAPVGLAPNPNPKAAKSKIGSMQNIKYRPGGGNVKVESKKLEFGEKAKSKVGSTDNIRYKPGGGEKKMTTQKLEWKVQSKIGSLDNTTHKPGGGQKKIETKKLDFKASASSKVGSRENIKHSPGSSEVKIESYKLDFKGKASSKVGSMDNIKHVPAGGDVKIYNEKVGFKDRASSRIGSLPSQTEGSTSGDQSPNPTSPLPPSKGDEQASRASTGQSVQSEATSSNEEPAITTPSTATEHAQPNSPPASTTPKLPPIDPSSPPPNSEVAGNPTNEVAAEQNIPVN